MAFRIVTCRKVSFIYRHNESDNQGRNQENRWFDRWIYIEKKRAGSFCGKVMGSCNLQAVFGFCDLNIPCRVPLLSGKFKCPAYSLAGISG